MKEEWRSIVGYEGQYEVSNLGRVRSLDRMDSRGWSRKGKIMKAKCSGGYPQVSLCKNGVPSNFKIHALVAEAFIGPRPVGYEVSHKDNSRDNNRIDNLEYVTHRGNVINSARDAQFGHVLSAEEVQDLREFVAENPRVHIDDLIDRYGAERHVIYDVLSCRGYMHVPNRDGSEPMPISRQRGN